MSVREPVEILTPRGNTIRAEVDYDSGEVAPAKVVHAHTGVITPLDEKIVNDLADLFRVSALKMQAEAKSEDVMNRAPGGRAMFQQLGPEHPGIRPYAQEYAQHQLVARQAGEAALRLGIRVGSGADRIAEASERAHLPKLTGTARQV